MKILITLPNMSAGSGLSRYAVNVADILSHDHDITIMTTHDEKETEFGKSALKSIKRNIKYFNIGNFNKYLRYPIAIYHIAKEKPDLILNNYNGLIQYILPYINKNIKIMHVLHNDTDDFYRIGAINANRINKWIAPTIAIKEHFNEYTGYRYEDQIKVIHHGVNTGLNPIRNSSKLEIVFTGVLYEHKGVKELPSIIQYLSNKNIDFHFTIIGGGILENWLKSQFKEDIENKKVTFTGILNHEDVYQKMSEADIFLYPTHLDAFGLVIAEAMANGAVPVVTHLKGVTDNLITHKKNGYLIPHADIEGFSEAIISLAEDKELLQSMSLAARETVEKFFTLDKMKNKYNELIETI